MYDLNFPSGGMHGYKCIYWGFLPDDATGTKMVKITGDTGKKANTEVNLSNLLDLKSVADKSNTRSVLSNQLFDIQW